MAREFDMLGDPIPENYGRAGANGHMPSAKNVSRVRGLLVSGAHKKDIAKDLGISIPTLSKHYFHSGRLNVKNARRRARAELRAKLLLKLDEQVDKGNVSAMRTMKMILDEEDIRDTAEEAAGGPDRKSKTVPMPKGKKEMLTSQAEAAIEADPLLNPESFH